MKNIHLERNAQSAKGAIDSLISEIESLEDSNAEKDEEIEKLREIIEGLEKEVEQLQDSINY